MKWIDRFYSSNSEDLFAKCESLFEYIQEVNSQYKLSGTFAFPILSGLDREIEVLNPWTSKKESWLCFDSNGYLGLQHHPRVKQKVQSVVDEMGAGTPSVPLLGGSQKYSEQLIQTVSDFHDRESALIFSSGYSVNCGVVSGLVRKSDAVLLDEKAHMSLHHGAEISRSQEVHYYKNNDMQSLEDQLKKIRSSRQVRGILVATDAVFSMSGDILPLPDFLTICKKFGARSLVDEAHSVGVLGLHGKGIEEHFKLPGQIDVITGTFSKAFGFVGGYVTGKKSLVEYLRYSAASWIYSTSLPSCVTAGILESIKVCLEEPVHLKNFKANREELWKKMQEIQIPAPLGLGGIYPIIVGENENLLKAVEILAAHKIKCGAVTFPAVPRGKSLLRVVPTARHLKHDFESLQKAVENLKLKKLI